MAVRIGAWPRRHDNIAGVRATGVENGSPMCPVWPCAVEFIRSACVPNSASRIQHFSLRMQHSVPVNAKLSIRNVPSLCVLDSALCVSRIQRFFVCPGFSVSLSLCVLDSALLCVSRIQRFFVCPGFSVSRIQRCRRWVRRRRRHGIAGFPGAAGRSARTSAAWRSGLGARGVARPRGRGRRGSGDVVDADVVTSSGSEEALGFEESEAGRRRGVDDVERMRTMRGVRSDAIRAAVSPAAGRTQ